MGFRVMQANLNHCESAQSLLEQTVREKQSDVAILCEQYRNVSRSSWITDFTEKAAIWACNKKPFQDVMTVLEHGFVWAKIEGIFVYSCYAPPSMSVTEYKDFLNRLVMNAKDRGPIIIAGDFNAWATEWGSAYTNARGQLLLEAFAILDIVLLNQGDKPTFCRGEATSIVDITFASEAIVKHVSKWEVSGHYTNSDHQAIMFDIRKDHERKQIQKSPTTKWKASCFDEETFRLIFENSAYRCEDNAESKCKNMYKFLRQACDASMPLAKTTNKREPVCWWNEEIAELRKQCNQKRRQFQRSRLENRDELRETYRTARRCLKVAIKYAKNKCWQDLCAEIDKDPWGRPYKAVMSQFKSTSATLECPLLMMKCVNALFEKQTVTPYMIPEVVDNIPAVTSDELINACSRLGIRKAPGPDGIPNVALKTAVLTNPESFLDLYNECMEEGVFPSKWKQQRLVLIPKGKTTTEDPASYRPLCMLDSDGKLFERIVADRLEETTDNQLSQHQYGFRKMRSTTDAVNTVLNTARDAISGKRWKGGTKKYCAIITLDIKNAFNTARWNCIMDALVAMNTPPYLVKLIGNYLSERILLCHSSEGVQSYKVSGGVPQGSVLGPLLWNIMYNGILRLILPLGTRLVAFADDVALIVVGKYIDDISNMFEDAMDIIEEWMSRVGLTLAAQKTEAVLVTGRKTMESITLNIAGHDIVSKPCIKYLGVIIDARLSFKDHINAVCDKASNVSGALMRLMPNIGGPRQIRRRLLATVTQSVLLYSAPTWASSLDKKSHSGRLVKAMRPVMLKTVCGYRTISNDALCILSCLMPIDIIAKERGRVFDRRCGERLLMNQARREERGVSLMEWQNRWDDSCKGRWTHKVISNVSVWYGRTHGDLDYYFTQVISGHGCFRSYLYKYKHDISPFCPSCTEVEETAEHVFFDCPRFREVRDRCEEKVRRRLTPESLIDTIVQNQEYWDAVKSMAAIIMKQLRCLERARTISLLVPSIATNVADQRRN